MAAGMPASKMTVLVAIGLHSHNEAAELEEIIGDPWVRQTVGEENHFARDDAQHVNLGTTSTRGTVVRIDRRFVEAELRIAQAQLVGWLEGLFHGIQAALYAQQMTAKAQFEEMRRQAMMQGQLPPGQSGPGGPSAGQYL